MSNTGLNSSIYHTTRNYLDLLNNFLVDLNYAQEVGKSYDRTLVLNFLSTLENNTNFDPTLRLIRSMIFSYYRENRRDPERSLKQLTDRLKDETVDNTSVSDLENFVELLKYQCDESYARLKGKE